MNKYIKKLSIMTSLLFTSFSLVGCQESSSNSLKEVPEVSVEEEHGIYDLGYVSQLANRIGEEFVGFLQKVYNPLGYPVSASVRYGDISSFNPEEDWKSRFYCTDVVLDYSHRFQKVSLAVGGSWGSQVFNFMPGYETVSSTDPLSGKQHYTLTEGYLSVSSVKDALPVDFSIQTGFRGFNRKYLIPFNGGDDFERIIHTKGYVSGNFNETQKIAIGFEMNNLMYDDRLTDNTLLQLNPYYTLKNDRVYFKAGAHVDWQIANKSGFKVAPDVQFDYVFADKYAVYIHALGGTRLNDFRSLNRLSPYWVKENQAVTSYTPLDGQIGLKASPVAGLGMKLFGGYRIVKNEMFVLPMYDPDYSYSYAELLQAKAQTAYAGAAIDYGYKDYFDISLKGKYYNWTMDDGLDYLLLLKPQYVVDVSARAGIVKNLSIAANYRYEARNEINNEKADALNNLSLWLDYEALNSLNIFVRFNNLLNKDYLAQNGYPVQGLNFMAGCSLRF